MSLGYLPIIFSDWGAIVLVLCNKIKCRESQKTIKMYYVKTVDLTPETRKKRRHDIPEKDPNSPSEDLTEVGNQRPYKDATTKKTTLVDERLFRNSCYFKYDFLECMDASKPHPIREHCHS